MLFRFDFKQTDEGKFLVDAHASTSHQQARELPNSAAVLYASPEVFFELIQTAGLEAGVVEKLDQAVHACTSQPTTTVCCTEVDLSQMQLVHLNLEPALKLYEL